MISFIVPIFNAEKKLNQCILSIRKQTYSDIEIILVNDGSTDRSLLLCELHAKKDNRIKVLTQENKGVSAARNLGLNSANYPYIIFVDSDDYIEPNMCESLLSEVNDGEFDIVVYGYYMNDTKDTDTHCIKYPNKIYYGINDLEQDFSELYILNFFNPPWNKLYKKKLIKNFFDEKKSLGEDLLFNLEYFRNVKSIKSCNKLLYHYNVNSNNDSLSTKFNQSSFDIALLLYQNVNKFCSQYNIQDRYRYGMHYQYFVVSYYNFQRLVYYSGKKNKEILKIISLWVQNVELQNALGYLESLTLQLRLARILIKSKNKYLMFCYFKLKNFGSLFKRYIFISNSIKRLK